MELSQAWKLWTWWNIKAKVDRKTQILTSYTFQLFFPVIEEPCNGTYKGEIGTQMVSFWRAWRVRHQASMLPALSRSTSICQDIKRQAGPATTDGEGWILWMGSEWDVEWAGRAYWSLGAWIQTRQTDVPGNTPLTLEVCMSHLWDGESMSPRPVGLGLERMEQANANVTKRPSGPLSWTHGPHITPALPRESCLV